jgi:peroxiredoxin
VKENRQANPDMPCVLATDADGSAISQLHLLHESMKKVGKTMAVPANILLDSKGTVKFAFYSSTVMDRQDPRAVLETVKAVG